MDARERLFHVNQLPVAVSRLVHRDLVVAHSDDRALEIIGGTGSRSLIHAHLQNRNQFALRVWLQSLVEITYFRA